MAKQAITPTCTYVETGMPAQRLQNLNNQVWVDEATDPDADVTKTGKLFKATRRLSYITEHDTAGSLTVCEDLSFAEKQGNMLRMPVLVETPELQFSTRAYFLEFQFRKSLGASPGGEFIDESCAADARYMLVGGNGYPSDALIASWPEDGSTWYSPTATGVQRSANPMSCAIEAEDPVYWANCLATMAQFGGYGWGYWAAFTEMQKFSATDVRLKFRIGRTIPVGRTEYAGNCIIRNSVYTCYAVPNSAAQTGVCETPTPTFPGVWSASMTTSLEDELSSFDATLPDNWESQVVGGEYTWVDGNSYTVVRYPPTTEYSS